MGKVAVVVVVMMMAALCLGNILERKLNIKTTYGLKASEIMYVKPVLNNRRMGFRKFTDQLFTYEGPVSCSMTLNDLSHASNLGRKKRMCSSAIMILLRAYCQWLVESGEKNLDDFCYKPPLNFK